MRVLSLFSGGGLGDYGLELAGMEIVGQVEIDEYCQKILKLRWPDVPKWKDIKSVTGEEIKDRCGTVDLISGGFPCQPFSVAGKQRGKEDDRHLWPEMFRIIKQVKPAWVLGENVSGIVKMGLDEVLSDLEGAGYSCQSFIIPACAVDAPHRRDRVWIVAYSISNTEGAAHREGSGGGIAGRKESNQCKRDKVGGNIGNSGQDVAYTAGRRFQKCSSQKKQEKNTSIGNWWWPVEPGVGRVAHGITKRVDRLKLLGNGQVVQNVEAIGRLIMEFELGKQGKE